MGLALDGSCPHERTASELSVLSRLCTRRFGLCNPVGPSPPTRSFGSDAWLSPWLDWRADNEQSSARFDLQQPWRTGAWSRRATRPYSETSRSSGQVPRAVYLRKFALARWPSQSADFHEPRTRVGRRGPAPGTVDRYGESDRGLLSEVKRIMRGGKTVHAATLELAEAGKIEGTGTSGSRAKRLAERFRKEKPTEIR